MHVYWRLSHHIWSRIDFHSGYTWFSIQSHVICFGKVNFPRVQQFCSRQTPSNNTETNFTRRQFSGEFHGDKGNLKSCIGHSLTMCVVIYSTKHFVTDDFEILISKKLDSERQLVWTNSTVREAKTRSNLVPRGAGILRTRKRKHEYLGFSREYAATGNIMAVFTAEAVSSLKLITSYGCIKRCWG